MNQQEKELLARFLEQLTTAQAGQKDREAESLIREAVARQPDAAYLLVQRALQLDQAFQATQAQAMQLQRELDQLRTGGGTSGSGSFLNDPNAWGSRPAAPAASAAPAAQRAAQQPVAAAAPPAPVTRPSPWGSNLLGTMAMTAGGVVAGSFLFQGIQSLMNRNQPPAAPEGAAHTAGPIESDDAADTWASNEDAGESYAAGDDDAGGDFA